MITFDQLEFYEEDIEVLDFIIEKLCIEESHDIQIDDGELNIEINAIFDYHIYKSGLRTKPWVDNHFHRIMDILEYYKAAKCKSFTEDEAGEDYIIQGANTCSIKQNGKFRNKFKEFQREKQKAKNQAKLIKWQTMTFWWGFIFGTVLGGIISIVISAMMG